MRFEKGKVVTLETDIIKIWKMHGWEVETIETKKWNFDENGVWIIRAKFKG